MARVKLGPNILDIWGSVGEVTYRGWKGITTVSSKPKTVGNPSTKRQRDVRSLLGAISKEWDKLTPGEKDNWNSYANVTSKKDLVQGSYQLRSIKRGVMTGHNKFIAVNFIAKKADPAQKIPGVNLKKKPPGPIPWPIALGLRWKADPWAFLFYLHIEPLPPTQLGDAGFDENKKGRGMGMRALGKGGKHGGGFIRNAQFGTDINGDKHGTFAELEDPFEITEVPAAGDGMLPIRPGIPYDFQVDMITPGGLVGPLSNKVSISLPPRPPTNAQIIAIVRILGF